MSHSDHSTPKANINSASRKQHICSHCMRPHHHRLCITSPKACSVLGCTTRRGSNCSASAPNLRSPSVRDNTRSSQHSKTPFLSVHLTSTSSFLGSQAAYQIQFQSSPVQSSPGIRLATRIVCSNESSSFNPREVQSTLSPEAKNHRDQNLSPRSRCT